MSAPPTKPTVELRAIERRDLERLRDWRNALRKNFRQWYPLNLDDQEAWFERIQRRDRDIMFAVHAIGPVMGPATFEGRKEIANHLMIGVVGLTYIDWVRRKAEASIFIGIEGLHGKGYGKAALNALLDYGFGELGLRRISAEIFDRNVSSDELFRSCGFKEEGVLRDAHFDDGRFWDTHILAILEPEWRDIRPDLPGNHGATR